MGNSQSGLSINQTLLKSISHSFNSQKKNHLRRHECVKSASGDVIIHLCVRRWLATEGGYWLGSMNDCDVNGGWRILLQFLFIPRHLLSSSSAPPVPIPPPLSQDRFNRMGGGCVHRYYIHDIITAYKWVEAEGQWSSSFKHNVQQMVDWKGNNSRFYILK